MTAPADPEAVLALLADHRSVREFADAPVAPELVRACVAAAQQASTSSAVQGYCLVQVTDASERATLAELCGEQPMVAAAGAFFAVCADQRRHRLAAERRGFPLATNLEHFLVCAIDAALFAQNLVLAFEAHGLGCCYVGGLRNRVAEADALLGLPEGVLPLFGLCAGTPAERPTRRPRLDPDAVLCVDRYPDDARLGELLDEYDARMAAWYAARGLPGRDWSGGVARKHAEARRTHLRGFYEGKGASLG